MNPPPRIWILKLKPRISVTISNRKYWKMDKLHIDEIQDYLAVCLLKKK